MNFVRRSTVKINCLNLFKLKVLCRDFVSSSETKFDEVYNLNSVYPISNENWQYYTQLTMISQIISNQTKCLNFKKSTILREIMREHIWTCYLLFDTFQSICLKKKTNSWIDPDMQQERLIAKRTQTQMKAQTPSLIWYQI